jgi:hypothetical protein
MKVNLFISTGSGGNFTDAFPHSSITGNVVGGPQSPEDEIIDTIDESKMSPNKTAAKWFLEFLANRRLTLEKVKQLSDKEQEELRVEFFINHQ